MTVEEDVFPSSVQRFQSLRESGRLPGVCCHCIYNTLPLYFPHLLLFHATHHMAGLIVGRGLPGLNQSERDLQIHVTLSTNRRTSCNAWVGVSSWRKLLSLVHTGLLLLAPCCRWLDRAHAYTRTDIHTHTHTHRPLMTVLIANTDVHKQHRLRMKQTWGGRKLKFSGSI